MASVEIVDETVIVVRREVVAAAIVDRWPTWWPDLDVRLLADLGREGVRWAIAGPLVGTVEVHLADASAAAGVDASAGAVPGGASVVVRYELHADPTEPGTHSTVRRMPDSPRARREISAVRQRRAVAWKRTVWQLKDELEGRA